MFSKEHFKGSLACQFSSRNGAFWQFRRQTADSLCGVLEYASAKILVFLELTQNRSFLHRELRSSHQSFWMGTC